MRILQEKLLNGFIRSETRGDGYGWHPIEC